MIVLGVIVIMLGIFAPKFDTIIQYLENLRSK